MVIHLYMWPCGAVVNCPDGTLCPMTAVIGWPMILKRTKLLNVFVNINYDLQMAPQSQSLAQNINYIN